MAFSKTPVTSTYSTERIPACYNIDFRTGLDIGNVNARKDAGMINLIPRKYKDPISGAEEFHAETRQPILAATVPATAGNPRGIYVWEKTVGTTYYFMVVGVEVWTSTTGLALSWTQVDTLLTAATSPVGFTEFIDSATNTKYLVLVDGVEGYVYTTNAAGTKITDVDFPTPHVPYPVYINGYLFLAKKDTGDIYNSNLNSPSAWTAGDFISSELYPDDIQAIVKINNYLLAIGTQGCEYFYDAANATASPLARYEGGSLPFGCSVPTSIAVNKNMVMMLANNNDGEASLKLIEDFKHKDVNPEWLIPALNYNMINISSSTIRGFFIRQSGELCYCLKFPSTATPATFVYVPKHNFWTEFAIGNGSSPSSPTTFPVTVATFSTSNNLTTFVAGLWSTVYFFGSLGWSNINGNYASASVNIDFFKGGTSDGKIPMYTEIRTPILTFDTLNNKTMSRFGLELTTSSGTTNTVYVAWANDYSFSSFGAGVSGSFDVYSQTNFPFLTQLGNFRQRAFKVFYFGNDSIRYKSIEMDINKGQQ